MDSMIYMSWTVGVVLVAEMTCCLFRAMELHQGRDAHCTCENRPLVDVYASALI